MGSPDRRHRPRALALCGCLLLLAACGGHGQPGPHVSKGETGRPPAQTGTLTGRITDLGTALALAGATVQVQDAQQPRLLASTVTAADGSYTLANLPLNTPLRVVSQPVTGAVAYAAEVSGPVTLVKDTAPPAVNLTCGQVPQTGTVAGGKAPRAGRGARIYLVQKRDAGGGTFLKIVVRTVKAAGDGTFQFLAVPPGPYEVHFLARGGKHPGPHKPHRPGHGRHRPGKPGQVVEITVKPMEATHVNWPAQNPVEAETPDEVEDLDPADA